QVGAVVDVERGEHDEVGGAHARDVPGVAGPVAAAVLVADGRGGVGGGAEDEQVVILPPAHRGEDGRGDEDHGDGPVVPAARADVPGAAFAGGRGGGAGGHGGESGEDVDGEEGQEHRRGGADLGAEDAAGCEHGTLAATGVSQVRRGL